MLDKLKKNEKGAALILVLVAMVVVSILVTGIMATVTHAFTLSISERKFQSTYYIAETAHKYHEEKMKEAIISAYVNLDDPYENYPVGNNPSIRFFQEVDSYINSVNNPIPADEYYDDFEVVYGISPKAKVTIQNDYLGPEYRSITIKSVGEIDGVNRTTVSRMIVKWIPRVLTIDPNDGSALFSESTIDIGNITIYGDIGTKSTLSNAVTVANGHMQGDIYTPDGINGVTPGNSSWFTDPATIPGLTRSFSGSIKPFVDPPTYTFPDFPSFPTYTKLPTGGGIESDGSINANNQISGTDITINRSAYIPEFKLASGGELRINHGSADISLVIDKLDTKGNVKFVGEGKVTLYIKDSINFGASKFNLPNNLSDDEVKKTTKRLKIYYKGNQNLNFGTANIRIYGSIFAGHEDVKIDLGTGGGFQGHIYTNGTQLKLGGGMESTPGLIFAPKARVEVRDGANIKGAIISNSFASVGVGTTTITFDRSVFLEDPFGEGPDANIERLFDNHVAIREK